MPHIGSKMIQQSAWVQKSFLADRSVFMGFAILLVVVYHLVCVFHLHGYGIAHVLGRGYVGVDIFLFFSGLGLCYSCTKNSLLQFYKNRFVRIYPLYFMMATLYSFTFTPIPRGGILGVWDYFCNVTSLSYYGLGGAYVNWYIDALFIFYIFFPLVFKKVEGGGRIVLICLVSEVVVLLVPMHWTHDCFVSRIGIFLLGILFYRNQTDKTFILKSIVVSLALFVFFFVLTHILHIKFSRFLMMSFFTPLIMYVFSIIIRLSWLAYAKRILAWLGKYTLEIYLADGLSQQIGKILPSYMHTVWTQIIFTAIFAVILHYINHQCSKLLVAKWCKQ